MSTTMEVAAKLVDLCRQHKNLEAMQSLYSPDIVSIEAGAPAGQSARCQGLQSVLAKSQWWVNNHEIHKGEVSGPWPNGDRFIVRFTYEVTAKAGPMSGKRFTIDEAALYTVKNGKITEEEFFYSMGG